MFIQLISGNIFFLKQMYSKKANFKRYQIIKNKDMEIYQKVKKVTHECNFLNHLEIWCVCGGGVFIFTQNVLPP